MATKKLLMTSSGTGACESQCRDPAALPLARGPLQGPSCNLQAGTHDPTPMPHLIFTCIPQSKQIIEGPVVDAPAFWIVHIGAGHGMGLTTTSLPVGKDADIVPYITCR